MKDFLSQFIPGASVSPLEATYLAWMDLSFLGKNEKELKRFMIKEASLGLNDGPMFGPGGTHHQRLNIATSRGMLERGLKQLAEAAGDTYI